MDEDSKLFYLCMLMIFLFTLMVMSHPILIYLGYEDSFHINCEKADGEIVNNENGRFCIKNIDGVDYSGRGIKIGNKYKFIVGDK